MSFYLTALMQGLCFAFLASGIYLTMKIFNIPDITTDGSYTLGGAVTGFLLSHNVSLAVCFPVVILAGALAGACTGLIHTRLKINALLSGILVMTALYSVNLTILGRSNVPLINTASLLQLMPISSTDNNNALIMLLLLTTLLILGVGYLLKTDFGLAMRATGNSESMIRAMGVNTNAMKVTGLAIANALTATSGFLMAQYQGFADINMGIGIVIVGLGSVIIGETVIGWLGISKVFIRLLLVIGGAVVFQLVLAFTLSIGIDAAMLKLVTAVFVLLIVSLPRLNFRKEE